MKREEPSAPRSGTVRANGQQLYYEIHGTGQPLALLHGGIAATEVFGEVLPLTRIAPQACATVTS